MCFYHNRVLNWILKGIINTIMNNLRNKVWLHDIHYASPIMWYPPVMCVQPLKRQAQRKAVMHFNTGIPNRSVWSPTSCMNWEKIHKLLHYYCLWIVFHAAGSPVTHWSCILSNISQILLRNLNKNVLVITSALFLLLIDRTLPNLSPCVFQSPRPPTRKAAVAPPPISTADSKEAAGDEAASPTRVCSHLFISQDRETLATHI